jgi:O-antigen ligase
MAEITRRRRPPPIGRAASGGTRTRVNWRGRVGLSLVPALLFGGCLLFGANQALAAQGFTAVLALALCVALALPSMRIGLFDLEPTWPLAVLFLLVLGVAALSLTPFMPGGPHPVWTGSGLPGAATVNRSATLLEMIKLTGLACAFVLGCLQGARSDRARATVEVLLALGAAYAVLSLITFASGTQVMAGPRLSGGLLSPNSAASVFGMLTVIATAELLRRWRWAAGANVMTALGQTAAPLAYVLLFFACLILTASRMGVAATVAALAVLLLWDTIKSRGRRLPGLVCGGLLLPGLMVIGGGDRLWARLGALDRDSELRGIILSAHWRAFLDSPLFGHGLGAFDNVNSQIMTAENYGALWPVRAAHNVCIQWLEEAGLVGATPMFLLIAISIALAVRRAGKLTAGATMARGLVAASLVVLIHGATDYALQVPSIAALWAFLLGLQFAFGQSRSRASGQAAPTSPYGP